MDTRDGGSMSVKRGSIAFEAGGKSLAIAMTTNAMCMYQERGGGNPADRAGGIAG